MEVRAVKNEPPNIKTLWLDQQVEELSMQTEQLRSMAGRLKSRMSRGALVFNMTVGFYALTLIARILLATPETIIWFRFLNFLAFLSFLYFADYKKAAKLELWPLSLGAASSTGFEFYKRQLERRLDYLQDDHRELIALGFVAVLSAVFAFQSPVLGLLMGVSIAAFAIGKNLRKKRELPRIRQDLNDLRSYLARV
jgi:hypothetical protein